MYYTHTDYLKIRFESDLFYSFTKFRLEPNYMVEDYDEEEEKCSYDIIHIYDDIDLKTNNTQGLGIFCGVLDDRLPEVQSKSNLVYVQFITDSSRSNDGFVAEVAFIYGKSPNLKV